MSFAHPEHFRDSATSTKNDPTGTASSETKEVDDKAAEDDEDGASEGDVDEQYEEEGNLPMGLWMDLLLAESIRNGRVECVPAPVRPLCLCLAHSCTFLIDRHELKLRLSPSIFPPYSCSPPLLRCYAMRCGAIRFD